jgi:putative exosortase-associated protein (TIGR04073 family)
MYNFSRFFVFLFLIGLFTGCASATSADNQAQQSCYDSKIGHKALSGFTNMTTSVLEFPKNIINGTNQSNIIYGVAGGLIKGVINVAGRLGVGAVDLVTIPIPTKPIAQPVFIGDNFDVDTTYGPVFRLDETPCETKSASVQAPIPPTVAAPQPQQPKPQPIDNSKQYNTETNQKLNTLFKEEMMK